MLAFQPMITNGTGVYVPPIRQDLSSVAGSASLACWIVLLLPQLIEQWRLQSAEGISLSFLMTWFVGDVTNLVGATWAGLLPQVIFLAIWYCFADGLVLTSYFYYTYRAKRRAQLLAERSNSEGDPTQPLLDRRNSAHSRRRKSSVGGNDPISWLVGHKHSKTTRAVLQIVLPILFVLGAGVAGFFLSDRSPDNQPDDNTTSDAFGPQLLGYISAVLYLGARIPQIIQNHRRKSVEGLSLLFFIFSTLGNVTYAAQIIIYRSDYAYLKINFPWILGSLGTIFEDLVIFIQFHIYSKTELEDATEA